MSTQRSLRTVHLSIFLAVALAGPAAAQTVVSTSWTGSATGEWFDATWSNGVPNNGGGTEFAVTISQPATVSIAVNNGGPTIDSLNLSAATSGTLTVNNGSGLRVTNANAGGITVAANNTIQVNSSLFLNGSTFTQGGGTITLAAGGANNGIQALGGGVTLTNASTINGAGTSANGSGGIGTQENPLALANQSGGLIDANVSGQTLQVQLGGASTNAGTL